MNVPTKYEREKDYQQEYRRRPEVRERDRARRKALRQDPAYREAYNKSTQARRRKAQHYIRNRIAKGKIIRQPCVFCGKSNGLAHHEDYNAPLDIVWVCHSHHALIHDGTLHIQPGQISHVE